MMGEVVQSVYQSLGLPPPPPRTPYTSGGSRGGIHPPGRLAYMDPYQAMAGITLGPQALESAASEIADEAFPLAAEEARKLGFVYHGARQMGTEGNVNLSKIANEGLSAGELSVVPHSEYGPPWIAVKQSDLPSGEAYVSRYGPPSVRGTTVLRPDFSQGPVSTDKLYLADQYGNIIGKVKP